MTNKVPLAAYGAVGSIAPNIVLFGTKPITMPALTFESWQYAVALGLYASLAALVATIYPYGRRPTPWKAFVVGLLLPSILAAAMSVRANPPIPTRGEPIAGDLWSLLSLF